MEKYFTKTHYELASEYLGSITPSLFIQKMDLTYPEFCAETLETLSKIGTGKQINFYSNLYFHMYQMKNNGEQIYYITPALSTQLARTICNSNTYFLRSPYREIYIQIDPGLFYINDMNGQKNPINGFYVYLHDFNACKHIRVMACSLLKPTPENPFKDFNFYFHIEMKPGKIQDQLEIYLDKEVARKQKELNKYDSYKNVDHLEEFAKFVFNSLLYITSKKTDLVDQKPFDFNKKLSELKSKKKKRKVARRIEKTTSHKIILVGSNIKDTHNDMNRIKKSGGVRKWKLEHQIIVANHWRTQWYGSKKNNTRHHDNIWIKSYEKGPEFSEFLTSKHVVK